MPQPWPLRSHDFNSILLCYVPPTRPTAPECPETKTIIHSEAPGLSIGLVPISSLISPQPPNLGAPPLSQWVGLSPVPHVLCFSLLLCLKLLTIKRPSWQPTGSRKILLTSQPSHISSLPFPKNAKAHYYTAQDYISLYPIKSFLIPESV